MTEVGDVLRRARARISTPEKWTKGCWARWRGVAITNVDAIPPDADCYCGIGAIIAECPAVGGMLSPLASCAVRAVAREVGLDASISPTAFFGAWQDSGAVAHVDVLAAFDRAIVAVDEEDP